ncbi:helix-hairpin-helix domain-containing protein [Microvirga guangxiensis]|uniref:Helix-hairpin-helix motif-containing protein n=1 Tax=Microvirga guangxiensis TaxID=549386 RepID=A0A1G5JJQ5_9HYPH|nr:helix-hairpin-helix domain-containing protein [Microvirga guangxiensis]SCY88613.1 Helix-hairpin-helix motif-containing protein [Microvirga guangxiensis]
MQIGNLSRAPIRSRSIAAYQLLRVFIVVVLAASGGFALSLTVEKQDTVASLDRNDGAIVLHADEPRDQAAAVQIASADSPAIIPADSGVTPPAVAEASAEGSASIDAPNSVSADHAAASSRDAPVPATGQAATAHSSPEMTGAVNVAGVAADDASDGDLVDLNKASFEELNRLRNAGALGRAIIKGRPYASVEDLVKRKVIRRSVYEKIKDQVAVR